MKVNKRALSLLLSVAFSMALALAVPVRGFSQGRGHGQDKKAQKFINGHDARDGRWDGRGPRPRLTRVWTPRRSRIVWRRHYYRHRRLYRVY